MAITGSNKLLMMSVSSATPLSFFDNLSAGNHHNWAQPTYDTKPRRHGRTGKLCKPGDIRKQHRSGEMLLDWLCEAPSALNEGLHDLEWDVRSEVEGGYELCGPAPTCESQPGTNAIIRWPTTTHSQRRTRPLPRRTVFLLRIVHHVLRQLKLAGGDVSHGDGVRFQAEVAKTLPMGIHQAPHP